jgi:hypothetical protein
MRSVAVKLFIVMTISVIGVFGADNSIGTWKFNAAKSKSTSTNPFKSVTDVRIATPDGGVQLKREGHRMDGTAVNGGYTCKYDGKECTATGLMYDKISIKQIDANTLTFDAKKNGGKYHSTGRLVISSDGKTLTQTSTGTDAEGRSFSQTLVYEKQ